MQVSVILTAKTETSPEVVSSVKALLYAFPKKGNAPAGYTLTVNNAPAKTAQTGGGKYPQYVYFMLNGISYYLPKDVIPVSGTDIVVISEAANPVAAKPKADMKVEPTEAKVAETSGVGTKPAAPVVAKPKRSKK